MAMNKHAAGAFDIRNVIGALVGIYGVILLVAWKLLDPGIDPTNGQIKDASYNLWCGLGLAAVAVVFFLWAKLRPITVVEDVPPATGVSSTTQ